MNHGTIVAIIHIADAFFEEICDLHVGEFAFERNRYVEDQVCVGRTFYYAKIVNGKTTVQIAGDFFNLMDNAVKYKKPEEDLELKVRTWNESGKLMISIQDNGIGIKKENLKKMRNKQR